MSTYLELTGKEQMDQLSICTFRVLVSAAPQISFSRAFLDAIQELPRGHLSSNPIV